MTNEEADEDGFSRAKLGEYNTDLAYELGLAARNLLVYAYKAKEDYSYSTAVAEMELPVGSGRMYQVQVSLVIQKDEWLKQEEILPYLIKT